jgi:hypothetical protein
MVRWYRAWLFVARSEVRILAEAKPDKMENPGLWRGLPDSSGEG